MRLSAIIKQFEGEYLKRYKEQILPSHQHALSRLKDCRSEYSPRMVI